MRMDQNDHDIEPGTVIVTPPNQQQPPIAIIDDEQDNIVECIELQIPLPTESNLEGVNYTEWNMIKIDI